MLLPSIRSLKSGSLLLAALAVATVPAFGGDVQADSKDKDYHKAVIEKPKTEPRFYVDLIAGGEFDTGVTDFTGNSRGVLLPNRAGFGNVAGFIQARSFSDTHAAAAITGSLELGYKVLPYLSVFTSFTYTHADGDDRANMGTAILPTVPSSRVDLYGGIGQYQSYAGSLGVKLNTPRTLLDLLHIPKAISPYASLSVGGKYVDSQYMRLYGDTSFTAIDTGRFKLYDDSWVFTAKGNLGYDLKLTRNFDIILESGYGYDGAPDSASGPRGAAPYPGIASKGSRVYSTVGLGAKLKF